MNKWTCPKCGDIMRVDRETENEVDVYCQACGHEDSFFSEELYGRKD